MDANKIAELLVSENGRLVAAGALFLVVYAVKNFGPLSRFLAEHPSRVKLTAALLAVLPAVGLALTTDADARAIIQTGIVALFGAMGLHAATKKPELS